MCHGTVIALCLYHGTEGFLVQELVISAIAAKEEAEGALTAVLVWLRFSSSRLLTWNKNYNIKPREISAAQVCWLSCTVVVDTA